ncbi:hypothetical protein PILCRDRAFT_657189 [Piloderma croceum F 1598]|uniref:Uncharacterized protein n=1 Tax=Piloderma croceum (strain F 1598) TaxID=765440 RepID=A0A0C3EU54_PILCF|nr:hypothetical protein PILCRDRAFT_657189 [Piloderma croceum F 1598]
MPYCSIPTGAIVGGVVVGLVAVAAFILLLLYSRSRPTQRNGNLVRRKTEIDPEPTVAPLQSLPYPTAEVRPPSRATLPFTSSTAFNPEALYGYSSTPSAVQSGHMQSIATSHDITTPSVTALDPSERFSANSSSFITRSVTRSPSPSHGAETQPLLPAAASRLTGEQLDLIHDMYSLNVPVADIASVMERMRVEREVAAGESDARVSLVRRDSHISEVLPSYQSP